MPRAGRQLGRQASGAEPNQKALRKRGRGHDDEEDEDEDEEEGGRHFDQEHALRQRRAAKKMRVMTVAAAAAGQHPAAAAWGMAGGAAQEGMLLTPSRRPSAESDLDTAARHSFGLSSSLNMGQGQGVAMGAHAQVYGGSAGELISAAAGSCYGGFGPSGHSHLHAGVPPYPFGMDLWAPPQWSMPMHYEQPQPQPQPGPLMAMQHPQLQAPAAQAWPRAAQLGDHMAAQQADDARMDAVLQAWLPDALLTSMLGGHGQQPHAWLDAEYALQGSEMPGHCMQVDDAGDVAGAYAAFEVALSWQWP